MSEPWETSSVRLRYRYDVIPPGLLPRLIVRTHALSEGGLPWRHGVILRHSGASALVREEGEQSELHVFILGAHEETRQILVGMVRGELKALHSELRTHRWKMSKCLFWGSIGSV